MDWIKVTVHTTTAGAEIVSEKLIAAGAEGTMVEDRADIPDPAKPHGYWELIDPALLDSMPEDVLVHAWFQPDDGFAERMNSLRASLERVRAVFPPMAAGSLAMESEDVHDEQWNEVWKRFYKPFRAGKTLVVKPTWEPYEAQPGDRVIEIDPGMAFGSGMHETTAMCLGLLEETVRGGQRVIDVGTGSGILAIGAALLGAGSVLAIDIDRDAVKVARENIAHNHLEALITAEEGNLLEASGSVTCDICVANIIADVICMFAAPLRQHIAPGGLFICSGIIKEREQQVLDALQAANYTVLKVCRQGEWVAMLSRAPED